LSELKIKKNAQGRLRGQKPVAVLDLGSNSIRMVVYERHSRALTPLYNEKSACALGQGVAATGLLKKENIELALKSMHRFALMIELLKVGEVFCVATSAVREAKNGRAFAANVEEITGVKVQILSGEQEAYFAALGAYAGLDGNLEKIIVGDLGGGSLELAKLNGAEVDSEKTFGLGVIRIAELSEFSLEAAKKIAREKIRKYSKNFSKSDIFCAIGGSWRALAKLHQQKTNYPLHMIQNYEILSGDLISFCDSLIDEYQQMDRYQGYEDVASSRRKLLPFGAVVLREILLLGGFKKIVFSTLGVREGYLYNLLDESEKNKDPLIQLCNELSTLRARSPKHSIELIEFFDGFFENCNIEETKEQKRLRNASCYLADIGWRAHPDYRGEQAIDLVAYGALVGIDHQGRAFLAQVLATRYMGLKHECFSDELQLLVGKQECQRARLLGAIYRVAFPLSAGMSSVLPQIKFALNDDRIELILPKDLAFLDGRRLNARLMQLALIAGFSSHIILVD
jgi:exopolyphosphatase/guanosine-5'-triphosphate,3'-diphosphate pyrophosphatase